MMLRRLTARRCGYIIASVCILFLIFSVGATSSPTRSVTSTRQLAGAGDRIEGHCSVGVTQPATTWYLPEGSSAWGFECWLLIQNPNTETALCEITYMMAGGQETTVNKTVSGKSRASFNMRDDIGEKDASIKVRANMPVIPERSMYKNDRREGHDSIGTTNAAKDYFLAEGSTNNGFTTYVLVQNPNATEAIISITYMTSSGPKGQPAFAVAANSRVTIKVNDVLPNSDFSTQVHGTVPIIAERAMYWNNGTGEACHDSIGVTSPSKTWYLAEGSTASDFETWVLIQNPNNAPAIANITYMTPNGAVGGPPVPIAANSRRSINVADTVPAEWSVSTRISSDQPVIAERSVYWHNRGGGHNSIGVTSPSKTWYLAEGSTAGEFETWVLIQNPNNTAATANITYMTPKGAMGGPPIQLSANSRQSINVADTVPGEWSVSTKITSEKPLIAERSMYWREKQPPPPPPPAPTFTYADYPVNPGLTNSYWHGSSYENTPTAGPWELKSPADEQATQSYVDPAANYAHGDFPSANAARVYTTPDFSISQFYDRETTYMNYLGYAQQEIAGYMTLKFSPPKLSYRFPFEVGDSWGSSSTYTVTGLNPGKGSIANQVSVLAYNTLKIDPLFGEPVTYNNCFLLQTRDTDTWTDGTVHVTLTYYWLVPSLGSVAWGEGGEVDGSNFLLYNVSVKN
jgi:hypothetical protein